MQYVLLFLIGLTQSSFTDNVIVHKYTWKYCQLQEIKYRIKLFKGCTFFVMKTKVNLVKVKSFDLHFITNLHVGLSVVDFVDVFLYLRTIGVVKINIRTRELVWGFSIQIYIIYKYMAWFTHINLLDFSWRLSV